ncbi:aldo/keto reductase [Alicyclobacillus tolerans]|uniref:aldo/keto reductase n=1 Tax=Alicyclobacillus tolerans TaxID=90970 RepID=UPI001F1F8BC1|nr:aldo/keto reductase [Alicyclobacillus tolerans]MCF8565153.1 aldo/keto reductase [Alicyclobacillus tolerans]
MGKTSLEVTQLGLGTAALGFMYQTVGGEQAIRTVEEAYRRGIRFFDTSPLYGSGLAELRLGTILPQLARESFIVATKAGYDVSDIPSTIDDTINVEERVKRVKIRVRDYSYDGIMRSFESSLMRLGINHVNIVHIHDADDHFPEAMDGAYRALSDLRSQRIVDAIGAGMNQSEMLTKFAIEGDFDCFLMAGRYTLLDQSALADLLPVAEQKGISIFIGGPFNSGILADPYGVVPKFNYQNADRSWIEKAKKLDAVCREFGVPLKAAALQFPLAHSAVASVLTGPRSPEELSENIEMMNYDIPTELWNVLKEQNLISEMAPTPK